MFASAVEIGRSQEHETQVSLIDDLMMLEKGLSGHAVAATPQFKDPSALAARLSRGM